MQLEFHDDTTSPFAEAFGNARDGRKRPTATPAKKVAMRRNCHGDLVRVPSCLG
jgi:hypothetical protein